MNKETFRKLMLALYSNNQLFIPHGLDIEGWIEVTFENNKK